MRSGGRWRGGSRSRPLRERVQGEAEAVRRYIEAYRRYCWPVGELGDYKLAPFHLLASEGHGARGA